MSLKQKFVSALTLAFAVVTFSVFASAQEKTTSDSTAAPENTERPDGWRKGEGRGPGGRGMHGRRGPGGPGGMMRGLHKLDLTDAQKTQIHTIMESKKTGFEESRKQMQELGRAKHEGTLTAEQKTQLRTMRDQMRQNQEATHQEILAILTAEQRTKLETMKQEMDQRRQERREKGPRHGNIPADKPTDN